MDWQRPTRLGAAETGDREAREQPRAFLRARPHPPCRTRQRPIRAWIAVVAVSWLAMGCDVGPRPEHQGQGPGHRPQQLALSARQELALGRQAYREILKETREVKEGEGPR